MSTTTTRSQVASMTAAGLSPRQIAGALGITTQAVYKHLKALGLSPSAKQPNGKGAA